MKISCRFEISFRSKWPMWNPYRFEFHFASIHVNTSKELTEHRSEIDFQPKWNLIPVWVHFASHVNVLWLSEVGWNLSAPEAHLYGSFIKHSCSYNFQKIHRKRPVQDSLSKTSCNFIKKETLAQVFSFQFWKNF